MTHRHVQARLCTKLATHAFESGNTVKLAVCTGDPTRVSGLRRSSQFPSACPSRSEERVRSGDRVWLGTCQENAMVVQEGQPSQVRVQPPQLRPILHLWGRDSCFTLQANQVSDRADAKELVLHARNMHSAVLYLSALLGRNSCVLLCARTSSLPPSRPQWPVATPPPEQKKIKLLGMGVPRDVPHCLESRAWGLAARSLPPPTCLATPPSGRSECACRSIEGTFMPTIQQRRLSGALHQAQGCSTCGSYKPNEILISLCCACVVVPGMPCEQPF